MAYIRGALNLSKKKMQLMFKGLWFWCGTAPGFLGGAFKQPLKPHLLKNHTLLNNSALILYAVAKCHNQIQTWLRASQQQYHSWALRFARLTGWWKRFSCRRFCLLLALISTTGENSILTIPI